MKRFITVALVVALLCVSLPAGFSMAAETEGGSPSIDATTGATPNYRSFPGCELKGMPESGGNYTCLKASPPYTYFTQDWFGVPLSYLLDVEVGLKADTTGIKVIAADDYSVTLTMDELRNANPDGLYTILAWKKGEEGKTGGPYEMLDENEGPFRVVVPQETIGPHNTGTANWQKAVRQIRAIEVQPTPPGIPPLSPESIPPGEVIVYGNVLNRQSFTVDKLKSIKQVTADYPWKNKKDFTGTSSMTGIPMPFLMNTVAGADPANAGATVSCSDGWSKDFDNATIQGPYPGGLETMLAWNEDGADLGPEPDGDGPIMFIRPQENPDDTNKSNWLKNVRVIQATTPGAGGAADVGPDPALVPTDRIILCGDIDPHNVPSMWYFAEGYTGSADNFETWMCVSNPNPWETEVKVEYMVEGEGNQTQDINVPSFSRSTINVNEQVGSDKNVSMTVEGYHGDSIVAERAMYWNGRNGGHCVVGVTSPSDTWYLAEGVTGEGFETWILLQNPGDETANVTVTYMNSNGEQAGPGLQMGPHTRATVNVADVLPNDMQVSTEVTSDQPVIAERAVYWNGRQGGTCATGINEPGDSWYMAEGSTGGGFETWVLLQNPGDDTANIDVTYMNAEGIQPGPAVPLAAGSRTSISVADTLPDDMQVSTRITSDKPIVAERAMYWNNREGGHDEIAVDYPKFHSYLAEGATDGGFESWILIQNPGVTDATVYVTYLTGEGPVERQPLEVKAGQRVSVNEFDDVGANYQVSARIFSTAPVAVERSVYWSNRAEGSCSRGFLDW